MSQFSRFLVSFREIRKLQRDVSRSFRRPVTLENLARQSALYNAAISCRQRIIDRRVPVSVAFTARELRDCARFIGLLDSLQAFRTAARASAPVRARLEAELWDMCSLTYPSLVAPADHADRVLCVRTGGGATLALAFYLESCTLVTAKHASVVCIPRWLHRVFCPATPEAPSDPSAIVHLGPRHYVLPQHSTPGVDVPSHDVLASTLKLWSGDKTDLYHDLPAAIAAASRLT